MLRTKITISTATGNAVVLATSITEQIFSVDVRNCKKPITLGPKPVTLETEGETIEITFQSAFGKFAKGANFNVVGFTTAVLQPDTAEVFLSGEGRYVGCSGCQIKTK
jgi:hypothetical protein